MLWCSNNSTETRMNNVARIEARMRGRVEIKLRLLSTRKIQIISNARTRVCPV
jgi:hypothetical protein